jgi:hypothetical protein
MILTQQNDRSENEMLDLLLFLGSALTLATAGDAAASFFLL